MAHILFAALTRAKVSPWRAGHMVHSEELRAAKAAGSDRRAINGNT